MSQEQEESPQGAHLPEHETIADVAAERLILDRAIGGWRGLIDSGVPTLVFVLAFLVWPDTLANAVYAAIAAGVIILIVRVIRRDPLTQIFAGFVGLAIAAGFSAWTGKAENFFLPGLLTNLAYGSAFLISILVRWPLLGVALGYFTGTGTSWRNEVPLRRAAAAASWIWVGMFFGRLLVQVPFYFSGSVGTLGVIKIVMGWPLFLAAAYFTYRVLAPVYAELNARKAQNPESDA
ncbi:MAG: DUF3159 domain-containing protein [Candidatus Nanopelagicales bacterium]